MRWPKGPPHLALNPPYLFIYFCFCFGVFFVPFLSLLLIEKPCFPPKKEPFLLFFVFLFLSPSTFVYLPLFLFLFLCLSLALVFLSSFLSFFSFCFLFLSLFHFSFFFAFVSEKNMKILNCNLFFINLFSFLWFPVLLFLSNPFSLSLFFLDFKLCFC